MDRRGRIAAVCAALATIAPVARAETGGGDADPELRRRVLRRVEQWLQEDEPRLRREIQKLLDESLPPDAAHGRDARPAAFLGVSVEPLEESQRLAIDLADDEGVRILSVRPGSPADRAGLAAGDILLRIARKRVGSPDAVRDAVRAHRPGDTAALVYLRDGQTRHARAQLEAAPADAGPGPEPADPAAPFEIESFLDALFHPPAGTESPIRGLMEALSAEPAGDMILAFLRAELRTNAALLQEHAERGPDGRWRLREDSVEFLRSWLEEELARDRKREAQEDARRKGKKAEGPAAETNKPARLRLGVFVRDLTAEERAAASLPAGTGFAVTRLVPDGPAMRGGLRPGDIVAAIGGRGATEALLQEALAKARTGDAINFSVLRGPSREPVEAKVTPEEAR
jgi:S1-C subfamily serine protease